MSLAKLMCASHGKVPAYINIIIANFNWVLIELQAVCLPFTYIISFNAPHVPFSTAEETEGWECTVTCPSCPTVKCRVGFKYRPGWLAFEPKFLIAPLCSWDGPSSSWALDHKPHPVTIPVHGNGIFLQELNRHHQEWRHRPKSMLSPNKYGKSNCPPEPQWFYVLRSRLRRWN